MKNCNLQLCSQHIFSLSRNHTKPYPHSPSGISCVLICKVCKTLLVLIHYSCHLLAFTRYCVKVHSWKYSDLRALIVSFSYCYHFVIHLSDYLIICLFVYLIICLFSLLYKHLSVCLYILKAIISMYSIFRHCEVWKEGQRCQEWSQA